MCTGNVLMYAATLSADGELDGEPFLIGALPLGDHKVKVRHGMGLAVWPEPAKGVDCWVYDEREPHQQEAPVGVSFVSFEKPGHLMDDPMQVIIHRDNVRKTLERQLQRGVPSRQDELEALLARTNQRLDELLAEREQSEEASDDQGEPEQGASA